MAGDVARFSGVLCPALTPFRDDLEPDEGRFIEHCRRLCDQGMNLAVFGTTSEGNSLSVAEKQALLEGLIDADVDAASLMPGTGSASLADAVAMTRHAVTLGCRGVLLLPPFYYKDVDDDGLFRYVAETIERTGDRRLRVYLYHIPPVARIGYSLPLIERLLRAYPETIAGIKDSSGDWLNTAAMHERQWDDFRIFAGSETFLLANMRAGGAGCISATANINGRAINALYRSWRKDDAADRQRALDDLRGVLQALPMIPALKAVIEHYDDDPGWANLRPPLEPLDESRRRALIDALDARSFRLRPGGP